MIKEVMADAHERMEKTIDSLRQDLMTIRTGRASPALVEHLTIEYYGMRTPLLQLATMSIPEAQQIVIRPYARGDIGAIEKAIAKSDLGLTPNNDGQQIRLKGRIVGCERAVGVVEDHAECRRRGCGSQRPDRDAQPASCSGHGFVPGPRRRAADLNAAASRLILSRPESAVTGTALPLLLGGTRLAWLIAPGDQSAASGSGG